MSDETIVQLNAEPEQSLDEAANVRYLKAGDFDLCRSEAGAMRMMLHDERTVLRIKAKRCFPFSSPSRYVSIRDGNDDEVGIIADLAHISKEYRRWIEDDLELRYFTPRVKSIKLIRHRFGGVEWHVDTDCGSKRLITKGVHDTMTEVEPGRYVITDVDDNRYEVFVDELDSTSREKIDRLI
jgi:hypothetical protein